MSLLSSIDTSQYTTPLSSAQFGSIQFEPERVESEKAEVQNTAALEKETPKVDLNNYYSNVQAPELNPQRTTDVGVTQASQNLSNAISAAVQHGMNAQDAVNIQKAKAAYETTVTAASTASTFEITVD